jgi:alpha-beta hydrolase superfamily lysophospholipase
MTGLTRRKLVLASLTGAALSGLSACAPLVMRPETPPPAFTGPRFESGSFVSFDGTRLPLNVWAPETEPWAVIVAVHGINDYAMAFDQDGQTWAKAGVVTYAYDQRGFGRAPGRGLWAGETLLTEDLKTAVAVARREHPKAVIAVLGHSMGGAVAISAFASPNPPNADRLILAAPAVWGWSAQPVPNKVSLWLGAHITPSSHLTPPRWLAEKHLASDNMDALRAMGRDRWMIFSTRIDVVYGLVSLMQSALGKVGAIKTPVLYLYGAHDNFVPRDATLKAVKQLKPQDRGYYYPEGWHLLLRDLHGDQVRGDVVTWLHDPAAPSTAHSADLKLSLRPPGR